MESDYLLKVPGKQFFLMLAFPLIDTEHFAEPNLTINRFGLCFSKKHGLKSMVPMITFMQDTMTKV